MNRSKLVAYRENIEHLLKSALPKQQGPFHLLYQAMAYSLEAGGKRIRPILMQLSYEAVGGNEDISSYLCALEMIHTYSLIHDDLPAMDNDDLRRGKPTNHKVFGEAIAILAGDGLLNYAFEYMLEDALQYEDFARVKAIQILAEASGVLGMIAGQILDIQSENKPIALETLDLIHLHKTGALIAAGPKMGAVLGHGSKEEIAALEMYGKYIGKAFQIIDDLLDEISTTKELGKPVQSDEKNHKITYTSFYTQEECYEIVNTLTQKAVGCLDRVSGDTSLLKEIAQELVYRKK